MLQHAKDFMNIRKVNSQTVEVIVPRLPAYAIDAPEEITLTIPAGSLTSRHPILASPSFKILTTVGSNTDDRRQRLHRRTLSRQPDADGGRRVRAAAARFARQ